MIEPLPISKARLEALTDGIFAVTMTLLVLDLKFTDRVSGEPGRILHDLVALLPYIDDYVISFVVLCVFWLAHMRLMRRVREVDGAFTWMNLAFLLFTTFVPPLTSWIGHEAHQPAAAIVYGVNMLVINAFEALMWRRACRRLANESVTDPAALWAELRKWFTIVVLIILAGIATALVEIRIATGVGYASYVYLLMIFGAVFRPRQRMQP